MINDTSHSKTTYHVISDRDCIYEFAVEDLSLIHFINFYRDDNTKPERLNHEEVPIQVWQKLSYELGKNQLL